MIKQILFIIAIAVTVGVFFHTAFRLWRFYKLTRPYKFGSLWKRLIITIEVVILQSKILRRPVIGFLHAIVFWGFVVILIGSIEMVVDGITGSERILSSWGILYDIIIGFGDMFALFIMISIIIFLIRRVFLNIKRFHGEEMKKKSHQDANIALTMIFLLMLSLLGMNLFYQLGNSSIYKGVYPAAELFIPLFKGTDISTIHILHEIFWWMHIILIFIFANVLPYSKHFHVFMSVPNVFLSRTEPLGKLPIMENVLKEVKLMMNPDTAYAEAPAGEGTPQRFGVKDIEDINRKNYLDALTCTECGRCTSVCPANITGKKLSPRKVFMDIRARMKEKGPQLLKEGKDFSDNMALVRDYISEEEIWACTTCNACANECPVNINHPTFIIDMRRYLVMEEGNAPGGLKSILTNIENNGAPWQFSPEDRLKWAE